MITEKEWSDTIDAGLGDFVHRIHGDRVDDSYEGNYDAVSAVRKMPVEHKALLKRSKVAQAAVKKAYNDSPRGSDGAAVLLEAAATQHTMWLVAKAMLDKHQPSSSVVALLLEVVKA